MSAAGNDVLCREIREWERRVAGQLLEEITIDLKGGNPKHQDYEYFGFYC